MRDVDIVPDYLVAGLFDEELEELAKKTKPAVAGPDSKIQKVEINGVAYLVKSAKKIKRRR